MENASQDSPGVSFTPQQRWAARVACEHHAMTTGQIARLMGADAALVEAWFETEGWRQAEAADTGDSPDGEHVAALARRLETTIRADLDRLEAASGKIGGGETGDMEKRTRNHLALVKSLRELADMVKDIEQAAHARRYPADVVEFRRQLERRIAALADESPEAGADRRADDG
ncbi:MAG: hypothetical protein KDJ80_11515 [Nitratireductor sp.]|nr:hypothetical protein [Nitratireductor sp.]